MTDTVQIQCRETATLVKHLEGAQKQYEAEKATFLTRLDSEPVHALEWSQSIMSAAAFAQVNNHWVQSIMANQTHDVVKTYEEIVVIMTESLIRDVVSGAANVSLSTSPVGNYMDQRLLAAKAALLGYLKNGF